MQKKDYEVLGIPNGGELAFPQEPRADIVSRNGDTQVTLQGDPRCLTLLKIPQNRTK